MKQLDFNTLDQTLREGKMDDALLKSQQTLQQLKRSLPEPEMPAHVVLPTLVDRQEATWLLAVDGVQLGPYPAARLIEMIAAGDIDNTALVWRYGMEQWTPIKDCPEIIGKMK